MGQQPRPRLGPCLGQREHGARLKLGTGIHGGKGTVSHEHAKALRTTAWDRPTLPSAPRRRRGSSEKCGCPPQDTVHAGRTTKILVASESLGLSSASATPARRWDRETRRGLPEVRKRPGIGSAKGTQEARTRTVVWDPRRQIRHHRTHLRHRPRCECTSPRTRVDFDDVARACLVDAGWDVVVAVRRFLAGVPGVPEGVSPN